jgi:hypothetical protein
MQIDEFLPMLERSARQTKEHVCSRKPDDINPFVVVVRDGRTHAQVTVNQFDPEVILTVAAVCATGFAADLVGVVFETYQSVLDPETGECRSNPVTGRPWEDGELADAAQLLGGVEKGWVLEVVSAVAVDRAGQVGWVNMPYRYVKGTTLRWRRDQKPKGMEDGHWVPAPDNEIAGVLRRVMTDPDIESQVISDGLPTDADERDMVTSAILADRGHAPLLLTTPDSSLAHALKQRQRFDPSAN